MECSNQDSRRAVLKFIATTLCGLTFGILFVSHAIGVENEASSGKDAGGRSGRLVEITSTDGVSVDLRYASTHNFLGRQIYLSGKLFLDITAADKLKRAVSILRSSYPNLRIVVFDGLRLTDAQKELWEAVRGTDKQQFVADPMKGSIHSFGLAVDVSLLDQEGKELNMGTSFDDFSPLSQPRLEQQFLAIGKLTKEQIKNRLLLRRVMQQAGFRPIAIEWWHFDALPPEYVRNHYVRY
jgi:zinc D-Ala-D-Ala dipeptidase